MAGLADGFSVNNPLLQVYSFYCSILVLKVLFVSVLTTLTRYNTKTVTSPEDTVLDKCKVRTDERVERVKRAHLNDLENIPIFFIVSLIYILTNPSYSFTLLLFRVFTLARIGHTFVYAVVVIPQPARVIAHFASLGVLVYMAVHNVFYFLL